MARSVREIYSQILSDYSKDRIQKFHNDIIGNVNTDPLLNGLLTSTSKTAIWRLWAFVQAIAIWVLEEIFDDHKAEMEELAAAAKPLTVDWYRYRCYEFQKGYTLQVIDGTPQYAQDDPSAQIIARAAVQENLNNGQITLKVVKEDSGGNLTPLTNTEKTQFEGYIDKIQGAGDRTVVSTLNADKIRITGDLYYNPLLAESTVRSNIETQINDYLANIDFNGFLDVLKLEDAIQEAEGVVNFNLQYETKDAGGNYAVVQRIYQTVAGYIIIDSAPNDLANTLNMVADV